MTFRSRISAALVRRPLRNPHRLVSVGHVADGQLELAQGVLADIGIQPTVIGQPVAYTPFHAAPRHEVLVPASQADAARAVLVNA